MTTPTPEGRKVDREAPSHTEVCCHADTSLDPITVMLREAYTRLDTGDTTGASISLHGVRLAYSLSLLNAGQAVPDESVRDFVQAMFNEYMLDEQCDVTKIFGLLERLAERMGIVEGAAPQGQAVPGWRMVPEEPTALMIDAAKAAYVTAGPIAFADFYIAMLNAAPPVGEGE